MRLSDEIGIMPMRRSSSRRSDNNTLGFRVFVGKLTTSYIFCNGALLLSFVINCFASGRSKYSYYSYQGKYCQ